MRTVITFDISDDRARYRVFRVLLEHATWVQRSVFEAPVLEHAAYLRMRSRVERLVDPATDSLRYYRLCAACAGRGEHHGVGPGVLSLPPTYRIV